MFAFCICASSGSICGIFCTPFCMICAICRDAFCMICAIVLHFACSAFYDAAIFCNSSVRIVDDVWQVLGSSGICGNICVSSGSICGSSFCAGGGICGNICVSSVAICSTLFYASSHFWSNISSTVASISCIYCSSSAEANPFGLCVPSDDRCKPFFCSTNRQLERLTPPLNQSLLRLHLYSPSLASLCAFKAFVNNPFLQLVPTCSNLFQLAQQQKIFSSSHKHKV